MYIYRVVHKKVLLRSEEEMHKKWSSSNRELKTWYMYNNIMEFLSEKNIFLILIYVADLAILKV